MFADGCYAEDKLKTTLAGIGAWTIEVIKYSRRAKDFVGLSRRWVVKRTFARLNRNRHIEKDC